MAVDSDTITFLAVLFGPTFLFLTLFIVSLWRIGTGLQDGARALKSLANTADDAVDELWPHHVESDAAAGSAPRS